jgi:hypothetical protein
MLYSAKWTQSTLYFPQNYFNITSHYTYITSLKVYWTKLYSCHTISMPAKCLVHAIITWDVLCNFPQCLQWMLWQYLLLNHDYTRPNPNPFTKYGKSHSVCIWITLSTLQQHITTLLKYSYRSPDRKTGHCHNEYQKSALYENKLLAQEKRHKMVTRIKTDKRNFQHSENPKTT